MATYDYECQACHRKFPVKMTIEEHEKHKTKCPKCGSKHVRQLVEPFFAVTSKKS
jgi:putative FmdB family regulatory protein